VPVRLGDLTQPVGRHDGNGVQSRTQCLGQQLDPVEVAHGGQHVRAVGALPAPGLQESSLARGVEHAGEQALAGLVLQQARPELAQDAVIEARVGQVQGEQVLPVDPCPYRLRGLPVGQVLPELHQRDQRQPPRRISRLAKGGVEVTEGGITEHGAEPVAQE
jgi:hypothetical protein